MTPIIRVQRTEGECILCDRHLCAQHLGSEYHKCPKWEVSIRARDLENHELRSRAVQDEEAYVPASLEAERKEINSLVQKINISALLSRASQLRDGMSCHLPQTLEYDKSTRSSVMGGMNYNIEIQFEDGVSLLARIRKFNATSPPPDVRRHIMRSEIATLQFLEKTNVPAPRVFDHSLEEENPIGVEYILMEKMPGKSLRWSLGSAEQARKVISQLADIYIELAAFPFKSMGSLDQPGTSHVGPFSRESLTDFYDSKMHALGPFVSYEEYIHAGLRLTLDLIMREEIYTTRAVDAFLVHRFLIDCIPHILSHHKTSDGQFYLRHADDKGDHLLVDDDCNITGIVDWEWAHTDPKSRAFISPLMLLPVKDFYDGVNDTGDDELMFARFLEEKGRWDLAETVRNGRILHRFEFCWGYDFGDWKGFLGLFQGFRKAIGVDGDLEWETWREQALGRYKDDDQLKELMKRHAA